MGSDIAIIFDLDGTLVDAFQDIADAVNEPLRKRGLATWSMEEVKRMVGEGAGKLLDRATPHVPPDEFPAYRDEMMAHYRAHPADHAVVYPGVNDALELLRGRGAALGVLSNKPHQMTVDTCAQTGIAGYFSAVQGQVDGIPRKPDPGTLTRMIGELGARQCIYVGDGLPDGEVARAAGVPFVAVLWGTRDRAALEQYAPVACIEDSRELGPALARLLD